MMAIILLLTGVQVYLELRLCKPGSRFHKWNRKSPMFGLAVSIVISMLCAFAFGAAGMMILASGLLSTCITQVYYSMPDQMYADIQKRKAEVADWFYRNRDAMYEAIVTLFRFIRLCVKIVLLPVAVLFQVMAWVVDRTNA